MAGTQAHNYAKAILEAMVERWQDTLTQAAAALGNDKSLASQMDGSDSVDKKVAALVKAIDSKPSEQEENLLKMILQAGDSNKLADIASALSEATKGQGGPQKAEITSTVELTKAEQDSLREKLSADHGNNLIFSFNVDESLLGGLRVRVGDRLMDNSVATRLTALRESLSSVAR